MTVAVDYGVYLVKFTTGGLYSSGDLQLVDYVVVEI
jgi:hypothetical protein